MQPSPQSKPVSLPSLVARALPARKREDLPYEAFTVAAILMVLITLWVF
ncbi:MAG: hypothetical protein ABSG96_15585 [Terracidiphilus sp.]|jgi:hypothetical protein